MKKLICLFNLFDANQSVILKNNGDTHYYTVPTGEVSTKIAELCEAEDIYDVCFIGSKDYALTKVIPEVDQLVGTKFENRKINFEVKSNG